MNATERDLSILEKIIKYCNEINEAIVLFGNSYDIFEKNSVYKNAVSMCVLQIGELTVQLSDKFKNI